MGAKLRAVAGKVNRRKTPPIKQSDIDLEKWEDYQGNQINSEHLLISLLIPPAVKEFMSQLESEVQEICGGRYSRDGEVKRWGSQPGSIILANQKIRIKRPRVRDMESGKELKLKKYEDFQNPQVFDEQVFRDGMRKVSQRDYAEGVQKIANSFGFSKSSVSRRWIQATEKQLRELNERDLSKLGLMAVFIDGKRFQSRGAVVALGVDEGGKKYVLGIYECNTENSAACNCLLENLEKRGMPDHELLFVVDGGSGLNKALEDRYDVHLPEQRRAVRIRCHAHKWRNVSETLSEETQAKAAGLFWGMRDAGRHDVAKNCADALEELLSTENQSALKSFQEAREDLLIMHKLHLSPGLRKFFSTTNPLESLNAQTEASMSRVKRWENSNHFQRWLAGASLQAEKRMRRVRGYKNLPALKAALSKLCKGVVIANEIDTEAVTGT